MKTDEFYAILKKEFKGKFTTKQARQLYIKKAKKKVTTANITQLLRKLQRLGLLKRLSVGLYCLNYNPTRKRKHIARNEIVKIFNSHMKRNENLVVLETEEFKFLNKLKKKINPIVVEKNRERAIMMMKKKRKLNLIVGDIDYFIKSNAVPEAHYFLDYCDTIQKHYDVVKKLAKSKLIDKLLAITFAVNRRSENQTNQLADAIKFIQNSFLENGKLAKLLYAKSYRDGMPMNVVCFKIEKR